MLQLISTDKSITFEERKIEVHERPFVIQLVKWNWPTTKRESLSRMERKCEKRHVIWRWWHHSPATVCCVSWRVEVLREPHYSRHCKTHKNNNRFGTLLLFNRAFKKKKLYHLWSCQPVTWFKVVIRGSQSGLVLWIERFQPISSSPPCPSSAAASASRRWLRSVPSHCSLFVWGLKVSACHLCFLTPPPSLK